ncbi:hypothetical protein AUP74_03169 [Microbulbifer aggregans]|uniref:Segregation and condensation protein B n=1 Tax=Microbulbifer aggregans TaxID=1769779 RepID=A0A1C9WBK8_9GAMM|nr:SMC-Scp complex subunit ScpB [Microbulbifer aggregans]AOS98535.1 hypothetical protein AUP74_03169 [Microbulbifer aggregans]
MTIAPELLRRIVEGALLASGQPLSEDRLLSLIDEGERPDKAALREALQQIAESCAERGFELREVASGWRFQVPEDLAPWVNRLWEEKPQKYSRATLETLAIIAYRQPITRGDIEEIRGVAVSSHIVKTLSERGWIKVVGQRDVPGRPSLYATTKEFLDYFNLRTLDDLPTLAEIRDIDSLNQALELDQQPGGVDAGSPESSDESEGEAEQSVDDSAEEITGEAAEEAVSEAADEVVGQASGESIEIGGSAELDETANVADTEAEADLSVEPVVAEPEALEPMGGDMPLADEADLPAGESLEVESAAEATGAGTESADPDETESPEAESVSESGSISESLFSDEEVMPVEETEDAPELTEQSEAADEETEQQRKELEPAT